jgi:hypothetical protein
MFDIDTFWAFTPDLQVIGAGNGHFTTEPQRTQMTQEQALERGLNNIGTLFSVSFVPLW